MIRDNPNHLRINEYISQYLTPEITEPGPHCTRHHLPDIYVFQYLGCHTIHSFEELSLNRLKINLFTINICDRGKGDGHSISILWKWLSFIWTFIYGII